MSHRPATALATRATFNELSSFSPTEPLQRTSLKPVQPNLSTAQRQVQETTKFLVRSVNRSTQIKASIQCPHTHGAWRLQNAKKPKQMLDIATPQHGAVAGSCSTRLENISTHKWTPDLLKPMRRLLSRPSGSCGTVIAGCCRRRWPPYPKSPSKRREPLSCTEGEALALRKGE